jgi:hypothetical protein
LDSGRSGGASSLAAGSSVGAGVLDLNILLTISLRMITLMEPPMMATRITVAKSNPNLRSNADHCEAPSLLLRAPAQ